MRTTALSSERRILRAALPRLRLLKRNFALDQIVQDEHTGCRMTLEAAFRLKVARGIITENPALFGHKQDPWTSLRLLRLDLVGLHAVS